MLRQIGCFLPLLASLFSGVLFGWPALSYQPNGVDCSVITQSYSSAPLDTDNLALITPENAHQLSQLRQLGRGVIYAVALSPDQQTLAVVTPIGLWLYNLDGRNDPPRFLCGHNAAVIAVAFSNDGLILGSASADQTARLWDVKTGHVLSVLSGHTSDVTQIAFHPTQNLVVTGSSDETVRIWDIQTGQELHRLDSSVKGVAGGIRSLAISPDGEELLFASSSGGGDYVSKSAIQIWSFTQSRLLDQDVSVEIYGAAQMKFSPDGTQIALLQGRITVIDALTKEPIAALTESDGYINDMVWSNDGTSILFTTSDFDEDYHTFTSLVKFEVSSRDQHTLIDRSYSSIMVLRDLKDRILLLTSDNKVNYQVQVWHLNEKGILELNDTLGQLENHTQATAAVALSPDGTMIAMGGYGETAVVYDLNTLQQRFILPKHGISMNDIAFNPESSLLATVDQLGQMRLWDATSGELLQVQAVPDNDIGWSVIFSPDGALLAGSGGLTPDSAMIRLWNVPSGQEKTSLSGVNAWDVAFSADGKSLIYGNGTDIQIWDIATGQITASLHNPNGGVLGIAYNAKRNLVATITGDNTAQLWDLTTKQRIAVLGQPAGSNTRADVAFSPDGRILVATYQDDVVLWDVDSKTELFKLENHLDRVEKVAFSADGRVIATGGDDSTVRLWGINP